MKWFKTLPSNYISTWEELENAFIQIWGEKKYHSYFLREFNVIKRKLEEDVNEFIKRFNKLYNSFQAEINPPLAGEKVVFVAAFEFDFIFTLRESKSHTLDYIQIDLLVLQDKLPPHQLRGEGNMEGRK